MSFTNNSCIQQAGADINTIISDYFLRKGVRTQDVDIYQPARSYQAPTGTSNWLINLFTGLIGNFGQPYNHFSQTVH